MGANDEQHQPDECFVVRQLALAKCRYRVKNGHGRVAEAAGV
jgi:hypothetical protein